MYCSDSSDTFLRELDYLVFILIVAANQFTDINGYNGKICIYAKNKN